jgi:hypothetical protein
MKLRAPALRLRPSGAGLRGGKNALKKGFAISE